MGASQSTDPLRSRSLGLWPIRGCNSVRGGPSQVVRVTTEGGGSQYHESRVPYSSEDTILLDSGRASQAGSEVRGDASSRLPLGTINVIFAAPRRTGSCLSRVLSVFRSPAEDHSQASKRARVHVPLILGFSDEDMVGTIQPHEDALVVTLRIGGYDVRRVMVDQGSAVDIMYPDLYRGLGLKPEDLTTYNSALVSFKGRMVALKGLIRLPVQAGTDVVEVDFIVVDVFSPYTAIMGRP